MSARLTWQETRKPTSAGLAGGVWLFTITWADDKKYPGEPWVMTSVLPDVARFWRAADEDTLRKYAADALADWLKRIGAGS